MKTTIVTRALLLAGSAAIFQTVSFGNGTETDAKCTCPNVTVGGCTSSASNGEESTGGNTNITHTTTCGQTPDTTGSGGTDNCGSYDVLNSTSNE